MSSTLFLICQKFIQINVSISWRCMMERLCHPSMSTWCFRSFTNLKSFRIMSATDILWPLFLIYFILPSYKIYYTNFMSFYHLRVDVVVARVEWGTNRIFSSHFRSSPPSVVAREIWCIMYVNDTTFQLTLYCILMKWHATRHNDIFIQGNLNLLDS